MRGNSERGYFPSEDNLRKECFYWGEEEKKCEFPNAKVAGRTGCGGEVDVVCLYLRKGRRPNEDELSSKQRTELESRFPGLMESWARYGRRRG